MQDVGLRDKDNLSWDAFDCRCLLTTIAIGWNDRVSNAKVRNQILGTGVNSILPNRGELR